MAQEQIHALACLEVWGGNGNMEQEVDLPGLAGWVYSKPFAGSSAGGDLYYLSVCSQGALTRISLADISGHGEKVSQVADCLRGLLLKHINTFDQSDLLHDLNQSFEQQCLRGMRFASLILMGIYGQPGSADAGTVVFSNAGQPSPLWYRARTGSWVYLEQAVARTEAPLTNLPLGIIPGTDYRQNVAKLEPGDLLLLYSDGLLEARNPRGDFLGEDGLLALAQEVPVNSPQLAGQVLLEKVRAFRQDASGQDDETLLALQRPSA